MAPTTAKKNRGIRIPKAIKTGASKATRLPAIVYGARTTRTTAQIAAPNPNEPPVVTLKVQIISAKDLLAKDRNGKSDPYVVVSLLRQRFQTPVVKATLNPVFPAKGSAFEFPIHSSLAGQIGALELVLWDKDVFGRDYLGEVAVPLNEWFKNKSTYAFDDEKNTEVSLDVISTKPSTPSAGTVQLKIGFVGNNPTEFEAIYSDLLKSSQRSELNLHSAPPTEGIGTVRLSTDGRPEDPEFEDDGLSTSSSDDEDDEDTAAAPVEEPPTPTQMTTAPTAVPQPPPVEQPVPVKKPLFGRVFSSNKRPSVTSSSSTDSYISTSESGSRPGSAGGPPSQPSTPTPGKRKGPRFKKAKKENGYNLGTDHDILGIVMIEIVGAEDLPKLKNMTRTGWDMDPFAVISFGKKVFRTRVIRHSLNPTWDEKLLFHVRRYESTFSIQFSVLDWDKLSSNDNVGEASLPLLELLKDAPKPDPQTGLYPETSMETVDMKVFKLPLTMAKDLAWEPKHTPTFTFRAKYQPYDALRQRFWRQYLKQYDADDTGTFSHIEITSMLDSLGSTLSRQTVDSFFTRHGKTSADELTYDEAIQCLETEVSRPNNQKKRLSSTDDNGTAADGSSNISGVITPAIVSSPVPTPSRQLDQLDFTGPEVAPPRSDSLIPSDQPNVNPAAGSGSQQPLTQEGGLGLTAAGVAAVAPSQPSSSLSSDAEESSPGTSPERSVERVINIKNCPLCHRPRLNSKAEVDIVTHLAVCASQDWGKVDRIVVGNFVTSSQAQRKWYTQMLAKVSSGTYQLGANSANIIVQNRLTGQLEEEKMQVYVRLGIRLLYKGAKGRMEGGRARRLLKSLSIKQGIKFDAPESVRDIQPFIEFHNLNVAEILDPISSFKTFNEFFYRKLKEDARPAEEPNNPARLVSGADSRMMAFETVEEATKLWIKGREFTVSRLLGEQYKDQAEKYIGGALAILRLAPQDYHRFHSPVDGKIGPITYISGEYYTVNPQAIRTTLDVYGENVRKIVPIDSPTFGRVMAVCIGAMMVGSIVLTVKEGDTVARGQEFGYFAFGGSTIVLLFEKGVVEWDEDLLINGKASLETLVRVGMGVGRRVNA